MLFNLGQDIRFVIHAMVSQEVLAYLFTNLTKNNEQLTGRAFSRAYIPPPPTLIFDLEI